VVKVHFTVHLAYAALDAGLRVLLVDMDQQGNLSMTFTATEGASPGLAASKLYAAEANNEQPQVINDRLAIIRADKALLAIDKAENQVNSPPRSSFAPLAKTSTFA